MAEPVATTETLHKSANSELLQKLKTCSSVGKATAQFLTTTRSAIFAEPGRGRRNITCTISKLI